MSGFWWGDDTKTGRVALGDGVGCAATASSEQVRTLADGTTCEVLLGWVPDGQFLLDPANFASVRTLMGGYALRGAIDRGEIRYVPARLGATPSLLQGPLRCDVLVASVAHRDGGFVFTTESAWQRAAVEGGAYVHCVERHGVPVLDAGPPLPADRVRVVARSDEPPTSVHWGEPSGVHRALGERVAALIPEGARVQYGPGTIGTAVLDALAVPVHIDTGMVTDAAVDLDRRGLLLGRVLTTYVAGTEILYDWAPGRVVVERIEYTHDQRRLAGGPPLIAVNTALEIDVYGQVNVEAIGGSSVAGIGGHPDYAFAAARSLRGLSLIALPTQRGRHRTLVEQLSAPVSTPSHDIDVVVTERGSADLRGLDRAERRDALEALWES
jgi:acyl-CoA hydrolase